MKIWFYNVRFLFLSSFLLILMPPTPVHSQIGNVYSSGAYFIHNGYRATAAVNAKYENLSPAGWLKFIYRTRTQMVYMLSQSIDSLIFINGQQAEVKGNCSVNRQGGYAFTATIEDNGTPGYGLDECSITITGPNDYTFSASGILVGGELKVNQFYPEIYINSPTDSETINRASINVSGLVISEPETGVIVNGILAQQQNGDFVANDIPLAVGDNSIVAIATDNFGNQMEQTVTVYTESIPEPVTLSATPNNGIAPLEVKFSMEATVNNAIKYEMDFEGDGIIDYTSVFLPNELKNIYSTEGLYPATLIVTDTQQNQFSDTFTINVHPVPALDEKWDDVKTSLETKDTETALMNFTDKSKEKYKEIFDILGDDLPDLASDIKDSSQIQLIYIKDNVAKYRIRKEQVINGQPELITYYIYFVKDKNGIWKIDKF